MVSRNKYIPYPIQHKLFQKLKKRYRDNGRDWISLYMMNNQVSKTPAYNRMAGNTPISFDEGIQLLRKEGLHLLDWQEPIVENGMLDKQLIRDCSLMSKQKQSSVTLIIQDLPLLYFNFNPLLASFKHYCSEHFNASPFSRPVQAFSYDWCKQEKVNQFLNRKKEVLQQFTALSRTEVWSLEMFDSTLKCIQYLDSINGFRSPSLKEEIIASIFWLIKKLKSIASDSNGKVKIYENKLFSLGNQLLFQSGQLNALYFWSDIYTEIRLTNTILIHSCQSTIDNMLSRAILINPKAEYNFIPFFNSLESRIKSWIT